MCGFSGGEKTTRYAAIFSKFLLFCPKQGRKGVFLQKIVEIRRACGIIAAEIYTKGVFFNASGYYNRNVQKSL